MDSLVNKQKWALALLVKLSLSKRLCSSNCCNTYTMVPCVQEVEELFCALLCSAGPGADPGFTHLQTLLQVHTVLSLLTFGSYRFQGVLEGTRVVAAANQNNFPSDPVLTHSQKQTVPRYGCTKWLF